MFKINQLNGFGANSAAPPDATITFTDSDSNASDATTTFTGLSIGTASPDRYLLCVLGFNSKGGEATGVTIAGAATTLFELTDNGGVGLGLAITDAPVTTGTTGTVIVSFDSSSENLAVAVYAITGLLSTTPTATNSTASDGGALDVAVQAGGVIVAAAVFENVAVSTHTGVSEDSDIQVDDGADDLSLTTGSLASATAQTPSIDIQANGSVSNFRGFSCAFR